MNVLTEMVKPIFSRDWDLEKCPEESLVLFFFWNLLIFELEAILGLSMSNQKSNTIQKRETFETFETQTPKNYQYLSGKKKNLCKATWRFLFPGLSSLQISSKNDQLVMENDGKTDGLGLETWDFQWTGWMFGKKTQKHVAENARTHKFWGFCWDSFSYCFHDILYVFLSWVKMHKDIDMQVGTKGLGLGDTLLFCQLSHTNNLKQTFGTEPRHTFFSLKCFPRDQMPQKLLGKCSRCDLEIFFNA